MVCPEISRFLFIALVWLSNWPPSPHLSPSCPSGSPNWVIKIIKHTLSQDKSLYTGYGVHYQFVCTKNSQKKLTNSFGRQFSLHVFGTHELWTIAELFILLACFTLILKVSTGDIHISYLIQSLSILISGFPPFLVWFISCNINCAYSQAMRSKCCNFPIAKVLQIEL